ncbi:MAG: M48 family metalloprotease [Phycisphaerales bacterium JB063]
MPRRRPYWTLLAVVVLSLAPLVGCTTNPATGRSQLLALSWEDEIAMGAEAAPEFLDQSGGQVGDQIVLEFVSQLGHQLAAQSENPDLEWEFFVLDSAVINAFALPGGKVFVSRGLLEKMTNEAQLAGVLGHEIGHVTARHGNERMTKAIGVQVLIAGAAIGGAASDSEWGQLLGLGTAAGGQLYLLKYSRSNESEADALGVRYMTNLGYNPVGQIQVMEILREASGDGGGPEWLATHPAPDTRIADLERLITEQYPDYDATPPVYRFAAAEFKQNVLDRLAELPPASHGSGAFIQPEELIQLVGIAWEDVQHAGCDCEH